MAATQAIVLHDHPRHLVLRGTQRIQTENIWNFNLTLRQTGGALMTSCKGFICQRVSSITSSCYSNSLKILNSIFYIDF